MKGTNLGEFEELVLLTVGVLNDEAYSIAIAREIKKVTKRNVSFVVVHSALNRLEKKATWIQSWAGPPKNGEAGARGYSVFQQLVKKHCCARKSSATNSGA
jgi:hypothetical protein